MAGYGSAYGFQSLGKGLREIAGFLMAQKQAKQGQEAEAAERERIGQAYSRLLPADDPLQSATADAYMPGIANFITGEMGRRQTAEQRERDADRRRSDAIFEAETKARLAPEPTPRNIDPLSPEGTAAAVNKEKLLQGVRGPTATSVSAQRFQADQAYDDAVGRATLALRKHGGDERLALAELAQAVPEMPVGIRARAIADAKMGGARLGRQERLAADPLAGLLSDGAAAPVSPEGEPPPVAGSIPEPGPGMSRADYWEVLVAQGVDPAEAVRLATEKIKE